MRLRSAKRLHSVLQDECSEDALSEETAIGLATIHLSRSMDKFEDVVYPHH